MNGRSRRRLASTGVLVRTLLEGEIALSCRSTFPASLRRDRLGLVRGSLMGERNGTCWDLLGLRWECCGPGRLERPDLEKASSKTRFSLCWATRASEESGKPLLCASGCGRDGSGPSPEDADSERWYRRLRMPHFCDRTGFERNREKRLLYRNAASGVSWSRMTECASVRVDQN